MATSSQKYYTTIQQHFQQEVSIQKKSQTPLEFLPRVTYTFREQNQQRSQSSSL